ncbi:MAG: hypothetical protein KatS3mg129_2483 [Leptospiraceae bacterium]|nr:MAG: hypothetical protein KatS3mg129_2483 [Leptospiraceae bacterium]
MKKTIIKIYLIFLLLFHICFLYSNDLKNYRWNITIPLFSGIGLEYQVSRNRFGLMIETPSDIWFINSYYDSYVGMDKTKKLIKQFSANWINYNNTITFYEPDISLYWERYFNDNIFGELRLERYSSAKWKIQENPLNIPKVQREDFLLFDQIYKEFSYELNYPAYYRAGISFGYNKNFWERYFFKISLGLSLIESTREFNKVIYFPEPIFYSYFNDIYNYELMDFYINERQLKNDLKRIKIPYNIMIKILVGYKLF